LEVLEAEMLSNLKKSVSLLVVLINVTAAGSLSAESLNESKRKLPITKEKAWVNY